MKKIEIKNHKEHYYLYKLDYIESSIYQHLSKDKKLLLVDLGNQLSYNEVQELSLFFENNFNLKEIILTNFVPYGFLEKQQKGVKSIPYNIVYFQQLIKDLTFYLYNPIKLKKSI